MTLDEEMMRSTEEARARLLELQQAADRARVDFHHGLRRLHAAGGSLREIAEHFGLSHQRVHQIVDTAGGTGRKGKGTVLLGRIKDRVRDWEGFTRFTKDAKAVVTRAQDEARDLGHDWAGTEHLLMGLLSAEDHTTARILNTLGVHQSGVRAAIVSAVGTGDAVKTATHIPLTPRAKKALELSLREAVELHHNYIGAEHILLGLVRESSGLAARILRDLGADAGRVRDETKRALDTKTS